MRPCARACAICCGITVVVLAVAIPLGICVAGPNYAQNMMDKTVVTLENSTVIQDRSMKWGNLSTHLTMNVPGPLGVKLQSYRATLSSDSTELGFFEFPESSVKVGKNDIDFRVNFTITNSSELALFGVMLLSGIPQPMTISGTVAAKALGMLKFHPKQNVHVWCTNLPNPNPDAVSMKCSKDKPRVAAGLAGSWRSAQNLPDCSTTSCPSQCQCAEQKCTKELNDCLADATCASLQGCVDKCTCKDKVCTAKCAALHPTPLALAALKCFNANCPDTVHGHPFLNATRTMPDCSTTACPAKCQCAEQKCTKEITDCLADNTCASLQGCVDNCKCGDKLCIGKCAALHPTPVALAALKCINGNCPDTAHSYSFLKAMPDCSTTACPATCQCAEQKCTKEITDCLADKTCATLQGCVDNCKCGDKLCIGKCAALHPTPVALAALKCINGNCPDSFLNATRNLPDCSTTACPSKCQCAEQKCTKELTDCLADSTCASLQGCVDKCTCGDKLCVGKCAALHPTPVALAALKCFNTNCPGNDEINIVI